MRTAGVLAVVGLVVAAADARPPAAWVTVTGQVALPPNVPVPGPKVFPGFPAIPDESVLVDANTRGVKNVVVWLRPDNQDPKAALTADEVHPADAKRVPGTVVVRFTPRLLFEPRVTTSRVGDLLVVQNLSPQGTNFFWSTVNNGQLNPLIGPGQAFQFPAPLALERAPINYKSNAVPSVGYVRVFDHPYYAVTDADGRFELKDAPAGKYRLVYWHENKGFKGGKEGRFGERVEIAPGKDGMMALPLVAFDVR